MTKILDGRVIRDKIAQKLSSQISALRSQPKLVIIQVGNLEESNTYIRQKVLFGQKIGAIVDHQRFDANISQKELISQLSILNSQFDVHGIIIQLPIPDHLDKDEIINTIDPAKDVDGQTSTNIKLLFEGLSPNVIAIPSEAREKQSNAKIASSSSTPRNDIMNRGYVPATTRGILTLLDFYKISVSSKHVVIVGRSSLVGKPTALALLNRDATVTVCHSKTNHLSLITSHCDILVVAAGKPKLITKDYVTKGQVVVDVGINIVNHNHLRGERSYTSKVSVTSKPETEVPTRKLVGDVDFDSVSKIVKAISPVPGGVGPMTVASLFENLLEAYHRQRS